MCIDGVRHGMISAQLCFVLSARISKWTTLLNFQSNTFCISTCLFIISLSTLIAPSAYPYATATRSVGLPSLQFGVGSHSRSLYVCLSISLSFCHFRMRFCHVLSLCTLQTNRLRSMSNNVSERQTDVESVCLCFVCRRFNYISFINWLNYNLTVCLAASVSVRVSEYCVKLV